MVGESMLDGCWRVGRWVELIWGGMSRNEIGSFRKFHEMAKYHNKKYWFWMLSFHSCLHFQIDDLGAPCVETPPNIDSWNLSLVTKLLLPHGHMWQKWRFIYLSYSNGIQDKFISGKSRVERGEVPPHEEVGRQVGGSNSICGPRFLPLNLMWSKLHRILKMKNKGVPRTLFETRGVK